MEMEEVEHSVIENAFLFFFHRWTKYITISMRQAKLSCEESHHSFSIRIGVRSISMGPTQYQIVARHSGFILIFFSVSLFFSSKMIASSPCVDYFDSYTYW